jgi:hypothetical protein
MVNPAPSRISFRILVLIALSTAAGHFCLGVWYWRQWVSKEMKPLHPPLELRGEDYLRVFPGWGSPAERDSSAYNTAAISILDSGVPRTRSGALHTHAPVFCYFLALWYSIGGLNILSVAVPQAVMAGAACFLVGLAASRIVPARPTAAMLIAALLYLVNLRAAMYVGYVYPTILVVLLTALALAMADHASQRPAIAVIVGGMALATFSQASFFAISSGVAAWLLLQAWRGRNQAQFIGGIAILVVVALKIVASTVGGTRDDLQQHDREILWKANNPYFEGLRWTDLWEDRLGSNPWTTWQASAQEHQRYDSYMTRTGGDGQRAFLLWLRDNPGQYVKLCFIRFRAALSPYTGQMSPRNRAISTGIWVLLFPAAIYGLWILRKHPAAPLVLLACAGYTALATFVMEDWYLRFRLPIEAMLAVFAAAGYCRWMERWRGLERTVDAE